MLFENKKKNLIVAAVFIFVLIVILLAESTSAAMVIVSIIASSIAMYTQLCGISRDGDDHHDHERKHLDHRGRGEGFYFPLSRGVSADEEDDDENLRVEQIAEEENIQSREESILAGKERHEQDKKNHNTYFRPDGRLKQTRGGDGGIDDLTAIYSSSRNLDRVAQRGARNKTKRDFSANLEPELAENSAREWWGQYDK